MRLMSGGGAFRIRFDMRCLDSIKFFLAAVVVVGHCFLFPLMLAPDLQGRTDWYLSDFGRLGMSALRAMDAFFVFQGLLASYTLARKCKADSLARPSVWVSYNVHVLLRIMPELVLLYWFNRLIFLYPACGRW
jgi:hypothetical protein